MGVPEARMNRTRKGSRLCLNSTRSKDIAGEVITVPDSAPSSPESRSDKYTNPFTQSSHEHSSETTVNGYISDEDVSSLPPIAPVASFYNLGNTCFMNCMLHVLRFTPDFLRRLGDLRDEINREEKILLGGDTSIVKSDGKVAWDLLRNMHDMYAEMSQKESIYKNHLPLSTEAMALRPEALLDSIRLVNPMFEANLQHDAQELLRCLLCGLDDAEQELRRIKQKRSQEQLKKSGLSPAVTPTFGTETQLGIKAEASELETVNPQKSTRRQPTLKGGRRGRPKKTEVTSSASKGILASFLKAKEVPGIVTKVTQQQQEPVEGVGLDKDSDICVAMGVNVTRTDCGQTQKKADTKDDDCIIIDDSGDMTVNKTQSSLPMCHKENVSESDVICCSDSPPVASYACLSSAGKVGNVSESSSSLGRDDYLHSVKQTEGRRSRLGVRGKAKSLPFPVKKIAALNNDGCVNNSQGLSQSIKADIKETQMSERGDFVSNSVDTHKMLHNLSPRQDDVLASQTSNPMSISSLPSECDKISELPASNDLIETSPVEKGEQRTKDSPRPGPKAEEDEPLLSEGSTSQLVLTPGREITIHSPFSQKPVFYTPQPPRSRNFLSRLGHFLPNSAKRFLTFSTEEDDCQSIGTLSSSKAALPSAAKDSHDVVPANLTRPISDENPISCLTQDQARDCMREAHIQLRRCDWLGVSPVKPISAMYVMRQTASALPDILPSGIQKMSTPSGSMAPESQSQSLLGKRKRNFVALSTDNDTELGVLDAGDEMNQSLSSTLESSCHSKAKRFKSDTQCVKVEDSVKKAGKPGTVYTAESLPKLSISLKKCDWLINAGETSVKIHSSTLQNLRACKKKQFMSPRLKLEEDDCSRCTVEASPFSSALSSSSDLSGQPSKALVHNLFGGTMSHQTRCCECESISDRSEEFLDISIPVPKGVSSSDSGSDSESSAGNDNSVSLILQSLASRERIYGENKYHCENCQHLVEAERSCHVTSLPKVLALHLKRFHADSSTFGGVSKINDHMAVPHYLPCLLHQCSQTQRTCQHGYYLYAVVTHSGASIRHGHYRTYVRVPFGFSCIDQYKRNTGKKPPISPCAQGDVLSNTSHCDPFPSSSVSLPVSDSMSSNTKENGFCDKSGNCGNTSSCYGNNDVISSKSVTSSGGGDVDRDDCWWLECDDDFIQVYEEDEFFGKLSQTDGYLLGTPYVLFYHQTAQHRNSLTLA